MRFHVSGRGGECRCWNDDEEEEVDGDRDGNDIVRRNNCGGDGRDGTLVHIDVAPAATSVVVVLLLLVVSNVGVVSW